MSKSNDKGGGEKRPKRGSVEWVEMEKALKYEAMGLAMKMQVLRERVEVIVAQIESLIAMGDDVVDGMSWEEKESWYRQAEGLDDALERSDRELRRLDVEYGKLRVRVNEFYGRDVLKESDPIPPMNTYDSMDNGRDDGILGMSGSMGEGGDKFKKDTEEEDEKWKEGDGDWWKKG